MSNTNNVTPEQLRQAVVLLQSQSKSQLKELKSELQKGNPILSIADVKEKTDSILAVFPCLTPHQARSFLHTSELRAGVSKKAIIDIIAPWIDRNFDAIQEPLAEINLFVRALGNSILDGALHEVNRHRRARGAVELATLDSLMQVMKAKAAADGTVMSEEQLLEVAPEILAAFDIAEDGNNLVIGNFKLEQVGWLLEIKDLIKRNYPSLANPYSGRADQYYALVYRLFAAAQRKGMGPLTAANQHALRQAARQRPNLMIKDAQGNKSWAGVFPNRRTTREIQETLRVQGPARQSASRKLSAYGEKLMEEFAAHLTVKYGFAAAPGFEMRRTEEAEAFRQDLLTREPDEEHGYTWQVDVTDEDLGFGVNFVDVEQDAADTPFEAMFGQQTLAELMKAMSKALSELGGEGGSDAYRFIP